MKSYYLDKIREFLKKYDSIEIEIKDSIRVEFKKLILDYCEEKNEWYSEWLDQIQNGFVNQIVYIYLSSDNEYK